MVDQATAAKTEEGATILTQKTEQDQASKEATLFKSEAEKTNAIAEAKATAIKELESKAVADKAIADKAAADAVAAEAAKKAEAEKTKTNGTDTTTPKKDDSASRTEYTLNLPENSVLTKEDLEATLKEAKASGLSEDAAKKLLTERETLAKTVQDRVVKSQNDGLKTMVTQWQDAVKKDPELGGEHLAETAIKGQRALKAVASPEMIKFLNQTGYGDHPEMVRMMIKVYDLIGEDKFIKGSTGVRVSDPTTTEEKAKRLFGNPIKEAAV